MKAYRRADGEIQLFRPDKNMDRMHNSAYRSSLPLFDKVRSYWNFNTSGINRIFFQTEMQECIRALVDVDRDWVPDSSKASLYIRPTMIGTEPTLGVSVRNFQHNIKRMTWNWNSSRQLTPKLSLFFVLLGLILQLVDLTPYRYMLIPLLSVRSRAAAEIIKWELTMAQLSNLILM